MKYFAIIVAGGSGKRMSDTVPKQFLLLNGEPLLFHSIRTFYNCAQKPEIIVVTDPAHSRQWDLLCAEYDFTIPHTMVDGGKERFHSVKNGLESIKENGIVAVHDGARPLLTTALAEHAFRSAELYGSAVPAVKPADSLRFNNKPIDRNLIYLIQTPQAFDVKSLKLAYNRDHAPELTDDATVAEANGITVQLIEGERNNIKITWPADLELAEALIKQRTPQ
ncbi:MAG: 2-C-methyl-D-erythritol 4-phosphate cytidylyltransferase [Pedobacter sp.]|nr:MAG: 2-C-methyl-D-erythritol 4-phosphate cytidylyltransferase [Pedobacter sp.]